MLPGSQSHEHHFEDAFHGGSCIQITTDVTNLRLYVTDFSCDSDIVVSYAFKRTSHLVQMNLILNVHMGDDEQFYAVCGGHSSESTLDREEGANYKFYEPLSGADLQEVIIELSERQERIFATVKPVNGWEIR